MTKAILIDSANRTISEGTIGTGRAALKDMQAVVGGLIQIAHEWPNGDVLYVDEEGMFKPQSHFFRFQGYDQPLAGNGLIIGSDDGGSNADVKLTVAEITPLVTFLNRAQAESWAKGNASEPAIVFYSIGADGKVEDETVIARHGALFSEMPKEE
jgi:hypothetical protein